MRIYTPEGDGPFPAIVYYHGSGWVILNIEIYDSTMRALANDTGCVVVAVNYQKAPEHKFPVPFNDAWAGLVWVADHVEELNVDPARIAVGGDSAGGNLAAAVAIKARDAGGPALAYQLLIYPAVETTVDIAVGDPRTPRATCCSARRCAGSGATTSTGRPTPRLAGRTATRERATPTCRPRSSSPRSSTRCATTVAATPIACGRTGVKVTYSNYDGMIHGFYSMQAVLDRSRDLHAEIAREVRAVLHV